jgi:predicted acetyltransferase
MQKGERISGLAIWHMPMRIGGAGVLMGGIGGVWTHEKHRMKGLATVVMDDSVAWMDEHGFDISVLFGIPDFYWRWGFITTLGASSVAVPTRHAENVEKTCGVRKYRESDLDAAMKIYNEQNARRTASVIRRRPGWIPWRKSSHWGVPPLLFSFTDRGRLVGVAAYDSLRDNEVTCCDLAAEPGAFGGVMRHAADLAIACRTERITFHVPPDHPFADFCREQGCEARQTAGRVSGGMARIINQGRCLRKVAPELTRRLRESRLAKWSGKVDLATDLGTTRLEVDSGRVLVAPRKGKAKVTLRCRQERLTQLLFGFQPVSFLLAHTVTKLKGDTAGVVDALFPKGHPFMSVVDHF